MSRWFICSQNNMVSETLEIDKPTDEKILNRLENIFNSLKNIKDNDLHYNVIIKELNDKYIVTVAQGHTYKEDEGTMPYLKQLLNRYNINYREI